MGVNRERLEAALAVLQREAGTAMDFDLRLRDRVVSTNQTLWELVDGGASPGTAVIAEVQTAGRGQWGRQWSSETGGLYLSLFLAPDLAAARSAQLTLCGAWGIATALRDRQIPVRLKWPNDLVLDGRKLGGILTETRLHRDRIVAAVIGVGINWTNAVPPTGIALNSFWGDRAAAVPSLEMLAALTLAGLATGYRRWQTEGIETLLPAYTSLLTHLGRSICQNGYSGTVVGVSPNGELRIRPDSNQTQKPPEMLLKPGTISLGYPRSF